MIATYTRYILLSIALLDTHVCMFNCDMLKIDVCNICCVGYSRKFFNSKFLNSICFHVNFSDLQV